MSTALETLADETRGRTLRVDKVLAIGADVGKLLAAYATETPPKVHGAISTTTIRRDEDSRLVLVDALGTGTSADDVCALGRVVGALLPATATPRVHAFIARMTADDPAARPAAVDLPRLFAVERSALPVSPTAPRAIARLTTPPAPSKKSGRRQLIRIIAIAGLLGLGLYIVAIGAASLSQSMAGASDARASGPDTPTIFIHLPPLPGPTGDAHP